MLVTPIQMVNDAQKNQYAIGSFNTSDLEITKAIFQAAETLKSPVIVETTEHAIAYAGLEEIAAIVKAEAEKTKLPIALHLDHGRGIDMVRRCIQEGYTSVMLDASYLNFDDNVVATKEVVDFAHRHGIPVEGEVGTLKRVGEIEARLTDPKEAQTFVKKTKVDFLAVSIGSAHGIAKSENLDIELLKRIHDRVKIPLVLHGGSGVPDQQVKQAIENGICKVNIDTDIRFRFAEALEMMKAKHPEEQDPRKIMGHVIVELQKLIEGKIKLFGSNNKV